MGAFMIVGLVAFFGVALLRSLFPARRPPQVIYVLAERPEQLRDLAQDASWVPFVALCLVVAIALWLL